MCSVLHGVEGNNAVEHADGNVNIAQLHGDGCEIVQDEQSILGPGVIRERRVPSALGIGMSTSSSVPDRVRGDRASKRNMNGR